MATLRGFSPPSIRLCARVIYLGRREARFGVREHNPAQPDAPYPLHRP